MKGLFWTLLLCFSTHARANIAVIVHPDNSARLTQGEEIKQIREIFLIRIRSFPGGSHAKPVDQDEDREIRNRFYKLITNKSESEMKVYWSNLIFSGNGSPPKAVGQDEAVKKFISENPPSIGYVEPKTVDQTVKVIFILKE